MPANRPRASFAPIAPDFDVGKMVENTPNFTFVDRISCKQIDDQGAGHFEKLVLLHVIISGKPLVIDGYEGRLDPWIFSAKWLRDNCSEKIEQARVLNTKENLPLTIGHYLENMGKMTNQFFEKPGAHKEKGRQRVYLKDIDVPTVWVDKLREHIPSSLFYLNESTGDVGGPGAVPDPNTNVPGRRMGRGIAKAGDLMSSLPADMRAENLMCYIGHEGTYTPAHREMCASLGQNIMVEASGILGEDGKPEKPGSSLWFMTESKDRHVVSEYWLSVLGHDIEVENHFAQLAAWKKAPFNVYVVEQRPGDFILIPPLAPHQVWNRGTRTMKVAWNRTTVETLDLALNEALPRSRIVCRDEQYKNKAIVYYTLQKYAGLLTMATHQASALPIEASTQLLYTGKVKQVTKDFKRLFGMFKAILLSESYNPDDKDARKTIEYVPFEGYVTCAYCRGNIFNRFLTCPSCTDVLGVKLDEGGEPYDVCMECYAMGRSCACISNLKWVEQFRWKELTSKYESWRNLIIALDRTPSDNTKMTFDEERRSLNKKTLAEVCKEQLTLRPWKDVKKATSEEKFDVEEDDEEIVVGEDGSIKNIRKKPNKQWIKNSRPCHVCCKRQPVWIMAQCTTCDRAWCYGSLFRGWDKMPLEIMEDKKWACPHCLGICFAGNCRRDPKMKPYEPKGTLLGHDTRKVADARSVEALVDFSVSNLTWLKDDENTDPTESTRVRRAQDEATKAKETLPLGLDDENVEEEVIAQAVDEGVDMTQVDYENTPDNYRMIDPALTGGSAAEDTAMMRKLQQANLEMRRLQESTAKTKNGRDGSTEPPEGYEAVPGPEYVAPTANEYPNPGETGYTYPEYLQPTEADGEDIELVEGIRPFKRRAAMPDSDDEDIAMQKHPRAKKPKMTAAGFRSSDLADDTLASKAKTEAQRQFEKEKERQAVERAKAEGRFIMLSAALRGKKRVVKMKIAGDRLGELVSRITADEETNVQIETDQGEEEEAVAETNDNMTILVSDIAVKKSRDPRLYYQQRERDGFIISSKTKKAMIPVEKDESYNARIRTKPNSHTPAVSGSKRKRRNKVDYEEVDIGSDDDEVNDNDNNDDNNGATARTNGAKETHRRALPKYLQNRQELEDHEHENHDNIAQPSNNLPSTTVASSADRSSSSPSSGRSPANKAPRPSEPALPTSSAAANEGEEVDEANRRAKLQALEAMELFDEAA